MARWLEQPVGGDAAEDLVVAAKTPPVSSSSEILDILKSFYHDFGVKPFVTTEGTYAPSELDEISRWFRLVHLRPDQRLADFGSGDGRLVVLAGLLGANARGIEGNWQLFEDSVALTDQLLQDPRLPRWDKHAVAGGWRWLRQDGQPGLIELIFGDFYHETIRVEEEDVVFSYGHATERRPDDPLAQKLEQQLKPSALFIESRVILGPPLPPPFVLVDALFNREGVSGRVYRVDRSGGEPHLLAPTGEMEQSSTPTSEVRGSQGTGSLVTPPAEHPMELSDLGGPADRDQGPGFTTATRQVAATAPVPLGLATASDERARHFAAETGATRMIGLATREFQERIHEQTGLTIQSSLGSGSGADLYQAADSNGALCVLRIPYSAPEERVRRTQGVLQAIGTDRHPGIAVLVQTGLIFMPEGRAPVAYQVLEWCLWPTLEHRLDTDPDFFTQNPDRTVQIISRALEGLDFLYRHGITHGDVVPGNLLISDSGDVKLVDYFGGFQPERAASTSLGQQRFITIDVKGWLDLSQELLGLLPAYEDWHVTRLMNRLMMERFLVPIQSRFSRWDHGALDEARVWLEDLRRVVVERDANALYRSLETEALARALTRREPATPNTPEKGAGNAALPAKLDIPEPVIREPLLT